MKSAPTALPDTPPNGLTCGIDWARDDHAVSVVDAAGRQVQRFSVAHTGAGLNGMTRRLTGHGVTEVASGPTGRWSTLCWAPGSPWS